jgi:2-oxoglutarate ferredoxin oxidoreductase subunit beta
MLAMSAGATFVARGFSAEPQKLADLIVQGIEHKGFSFIDVYSPCPTFNKVNTFKYYKDSVASLPSDHDATDMIQALNYANSQEPLYLGVFMQREAPTFEEQVADQHSGDETSRQDLLQDLFSRFS